MSDIENLQKLVELKDRGLITAEEFENRKKALLSNSLPQVNNQQADSPKSRIVYALLGFFLGFFGAHNFYLGRKKQGFFQIFWILLIVLAFFFPTGSNLRKLMFVISGFYLIAYAISVPFWVGLNLLLTNRDGQGRLMDQEGKPLCTALGVLSMVLVLGAPIACTMGIGGLAGFAMANGRYQANTLVDYAMRCAVVAQTKTRPGERIALESCHAVLREEIPDFVKDVSITKAGTYNDDLEITVTGVEENVGDILLGKLGERTQGVKVIYNDFTETAVFSFSQW